MNQEPLAQVSVQRIFPEPLQEYTTDENGICHVALDAPLPEGLLLHVSRAGFVPTRLGWELDEEPASLPAEYTLPIERAISIGGQIQNEDGRPVPDVTVLLNLWKRYEGAGAQVMSDITDSVAMTDREGRWQFDGAPADLSALFYRLKHPDYVEDLNLNKADLPAEQLRRREAVWTLQRGIRVEGFVVDGQGTPIPGAEMLPGRDRFCSPCKPSFCTDADGKFSITLSLHQSLPFTIKAEGFAPALTTFTVAPGLPPLRIVLEPGHRLRVRVVDTAGAPVSGVMVVADTWRQHRSLEWRTQTDAHGEFTWTSAPADEVQFDFLKRGYREERRFSLTASDETQTVILRKPLAINGTVTDARTGLPVDQFRVIPGHRYPNDRTYWGRSQTVDFSQGRYHWTITQPPMRDAVALLHVEANGYTSAAAEVPNTADSLTLDFVLEPGSPTAGTILAPDGAPVGDARIVVVFGNSAQLKGTELKPGHGNMALVTGADGRFSFPSQEPPYALVVAHELGYAFATAEEFASNPQLRLKPWGRLEIVTSSPGPTGDSNPVRLTCVDLPADARRFSWLMVSPVPRWLGPDRVVFENLVAGRASVGRSGVSFDEALNIKIENGKTTFLDFHLGQVDGSEQVPGLVMMKVVDEAGNPVPDAVLDITGFRLKSHPGSHFGRELAIGEHLIRTNLFGIAPVNYPTKFLEENDVESITLQVRHPDFCTARTDRRVPGGVFPIVLHRGATVVVTGCFEDGAAADPIYPQMIHVAPTVECGQLPRPGARAADQLLSRRGEQPDPKTWKAENRAAVNRQITPGTKLLRLVAFPDNAPTHFSDIVQVELQSSRTHEHQLTLRPGYRFSGTLDPSVPRPVRHGHVEVCVLSRRPDNDEPIFWHASTAVNSDGAFTFDSLPAGQVEVVAICEGFASKGSPDAPKSSNRIPQRFSLETSGASVVIAMEPTATVHITAKDSKGNPVLGAHIHFCPNVTWGGRYSGLFASNRPSSADLLQNGYKPSTPVPPFLPGFDFRAITAADGIATIHNIPAGDHSFSVGCDGYVMEALADDYPVPNMGRTSVSSGKTHTIAVVMHKKA